MKMVGSAIVGGFIGILSSGVAANVYGIHSILWCGIIGAAGAMWFLIGLLLMVAE